MRILLACVIGFLLDLVLGDPPWLYHPVRLIGHLISGVEGIFRKAAGTSKGAVIRAGLMMWILVAAISSLSVFFILRLACYVHPLLALALESFWCYQMLALRSLQRESMKVYEHLEERDLAGARQAVSMIVGRDTDKLDEKGVIKAAVETVAENTSDGVIAPLFYMLIGGVPLLFLYKAVNTMDSMVGYKNDKYLYFGRAAAKLDDLFNYLPARISGLLMIAAAFLLKLDSKNAWKIYRRDRRKHASPNAGQTEAVCAGALGVALAGDSYYFGELYQKPVIGDDNWPVENEDIKRTIRLMYGTAVLMLVLGCLIRFLIWR